MNARKTRMNGATNSSPLRSPAGRARRLPVPGPVPVARVRKPPSRGRSGGAVTPAIAASRAFRTFSGCSLGNGEALRLGVLHEGGLIGLEGLRDGLGAVEHTREHRLPFGQRFGHER